jgi:molybdenum-dependent DNA-binding transcriptional regulator ModE
MTESTRLTFTPVPTAFTRRDGWTAERQRDFIVQLARCGVVAAAAKAVGMTPKSAYALLKRPGADSFAAAWQVAVGEGRSRSLDTAIDRALHGVARPVFYRGRQIGEYRRYNDGLLIAALRATDTRPPSRDRPG